ncbi:hypothetical protein ACOSQ3_016526 [Xanthoceras sorbifolium]
MLGSHIGKIIELDLGASGDCVGKECSHSIGTPEVGLVKDHKYGLWLRTTSPPKERFSRSGRQSGQGTFANFATSREAATSDSRNNGTNRVMLPNELSQERVEQSKSIGKDNIVSVPIEDSSFPLVFLQKRIIRGCIQSLGKWTREVRMICQTDVQVI